MAKEILKKELNEVQNGKCIISGTQLPDKTSLYDVDRVIPKAKGGKYTPDNSRVLMPNEHQKRHGTLRERAPELENLKSIVDNRQQLIKLKNKLNNQLLAFERNTDTAHKDTIPFLEMKLKEIIKETTIYDRLLKKEVKKLYANNSFLQSILSVHAVGEVTAAYCLVYIDLTKSDHASSLWSYVGLDKSSFDRFQKGKASGGNKTLRTILYIMADSQIKHHGPYAEIYYRTRERLEKSNKITKTRLGGQKGVVKKEWCNVSKGHRRGAGIRMIMKHFLADYWMVGRTLLGLPTSPLYPEAILGSGHRTIMPEERGWKY